MDKVTIKRSGNFTQIDNDIINNPDITWKAKGLMLYFLSKPDNWKINVRGDVHKRGKEGRDSVYKGITELVEHKYISRIKDQDGFVHYMIFEDRSTNNKNDYLLNNNPQPENQDQQESPHPENQDPEIQEPENQSVLVRLDSNNTECSNTLLASSDAMRESVMQLVEAWNQIQGFTDQIEIPKVKSISKSSARYRSVVARIKEYGFDVVYDALIKVSKSNFLRGDNNSRWTADFGWVMRPSKFEKIIEDTYINKGVTNEGNFSNNHKSGSFKEFATELSRSVDENRHILDELPDDYRF